MVWSEEPPNVRKLADKSRWILAQLEQGVEWPDECVAWPWRDGDRRHTMYFKGNAVPVTHVVLHYTAGPRPSKKHQGLHSCDIQWCINPRHLRWGLEIENRLDQVARQRGDIGKIGLDKAKKIRRELEYLAKRHGVPLDAIARIAGGKTWTEDSWTTETETN